MSVVNTLKLDLFFIKKVIVWIWMLLRLYYRGSSRNALAGPPRSIIKLYGVIRTQILCSAIVNRPWDVIASNGPLTWTISLCYLTSNQVGLPAELKHINKRRNLAEKLEPSGRSGGRSPYSESYYAGWIWCSGTSVKAVDFIHYDEKNNEWNLLQVKNRDNTENSSSSKIRDNTTIKKWFRTYSQRDATNWDNFPDEVSSKNLNEEDFRAFVKNYLAKII